MKHRFLPLCLSVFALAVILSCNKKKEIIFEATVVDYYTNEALPGVHFTFKVTNSVLLVYYSNSANSYAGTSDANGKIAFKIEEEDKDGYFMPQSAKPGLDSMNINWWYRSYSIYDGGISSGGKIKLFPAASVIFLHPIKISGSSNWDKINISVNNQTASVDLDNTVSISCPVLPSREHSFTVEYIKNGISTFKTLKRYIPAAYIYSASGNDICDMPAVAIQLPE